MKAYRRNAKNAEPFSKYRKETLKTAIQLGYDAEIQCKITEAESEGEIIRAMILGRHGMSDESALDFSSKAGA